VTNRMTGRRTVAAAALGLALLAGCSRQAPEQEPAENDAANVTVPVPETPVPETPTPTPTPEATTTNAATTAEEEPVAPDAQMLDDADATGLTARLSRGDGGDGGYAIPPAAGDGNAAEPAKDRANP